MSADSLRFWIAGLSVISVVWMIVLAKVRAHSNVKVLTEGPEKANAIQKNLGLFSMVCGLYIVGRAPFPILDRLVFASPSPTPVLAVLITACGLIITMVAQYDMGRSWRIGVPKEDKQHISALVTSGLHRFSRNPIYLGTVVMLSGVALAAPGPLTIIAVIVHFIGFSRLIREEEIYLNNQFSMAYKDYCSRVRRWL